MRYLIFVLLIFMPVSSYSAYCNSKPSCNTSMSAGAVCNVPEYWYDSPTGETRTVILSSLQSEGESCGGLGVNRAEIGGLYRVYLYSSGSAECGGASPYWLESWYFNDYSGSCIPVCTSFTYSEWSICSGGTQTRSVLTSLPAGCTGGTPGPLTQSCTPPEPAECSNGDYDIGTEEGTDCGGPCSAPCTSVCGNGDELVLLVIANAPARDVCHKTAPLDALGNCPTLFTKDGDGCVFQYDPAKVCPTCDQPVITTPQIYIEFHPDTSSSSSSSSSAPTTVTNPDNSTTTTQSVTQASSSPTSSTSSTTITTVVKDAAGNPVSETQQTEESGSANLRAGNYDWSSPTFDGTGATVQAGRFTSRFSTFQDRMLNAPVYVPLKAIFSPSMANKNPVYMANAGSYGTFEVNFADYSDAWAVIRVALCFVAMFVAARIVIVNK